MSIPANVQKMMRREGVYLIGSEADPARYVVVHVDHRGVIHQMKFDDELRPDGWYSDVIVRGPVTPYDEPMS